MKKNIIQFISVTDFMTSSRAILESNIFLTHRDILIPQRYPNAEDQSLDELQQISRVRNIHLGIGIMMSRKTLTGEQTKWSKAFPKNKEIAGIFSSTQYVKNVFRVLHYADFDEGMTKLEHLVKATEYGGPHMDALQLDMCWPSIWMVKKYKAAFPHIKVILQIGTKAFGIADTDADLIGRISAYDNAIDYVLVDRSGGKGIPLDPAKTITTVETIKDAFPNLGIVVAGGLGPDSGDILEPIVEKFPDISIDAQGRLRPSHDALNEQIDWNLAEKYFINSLNIFNKYK